MKFDPTISYGTILAIISICFTIIGSGLAFYSGVTRHMTKTEEEIKALLLRVKAVEVEQKEQSKVMASVRELLAAMEASVKILLGRER